MSNGEIAFEYFNGADLNMVWRVVRRKTHRNKEYFITQWFDNEQAVEEAIGFLGGKGEFHSVVKYIRQEEGGEG